MTTTLSPIGIAFVSTLSRVVFPDDVPPHTKQLYPAFTSFSKNTAISGVSVSFSMRSSISITLSGNFLMVRIGPFSAIFLYTAWTLDPSESLASTIGLSSLISRLTFADILLINSSRSSVLSKWTGTRSIFPCLSINISSLPLTIISEIDLSSMYG